MPERRAPPWTYLRRLAPRLGAAQRREASDRAGVLGAAVARSLARSRRPELVPVATEAMGSAVVTAQRYLKQLGYLDGVVDGLAGPRTRDAVRSFQRASGLAADGRIDAELAALLVATGRERRNAAAPE